jgi:uncharacterized protein
LELLPWLAQKLSCALVRACQWPTLNARFGSEQKENRMEQARQNGGGQPWVGVKNSAIHGLGLFAGVAIPAGTPVIEYVGERITKQESLARCAANNEYIFSVDEQFDLDGNVAWNPARFANHSCAPNCAAELADGRIWIVANRAIPAGEEITFNYSYDLDDYREHPCRCGAPGCVGYIVAEEYHPQLRRVLNLPDPTASPEPASPAR